MDEIPRRYDPQAAESKWRRRWDEWGIYRWDPDRGREESFVIDTPPPTVSGSLHLGHVFSYTQQDFLARYQRMRGRNVFYPMGWDDNGLPTERRVQNVFGIRASLDVPYDPDWSPRRDRPGDAPVEEVSRLNFIETCDVLCKEDEAAFEELWRRAALSVDWTQSYATIDPHCRRMAQLSFLDLVGKGEVYQALAPTLWDVDFRTAIAQAEVEDRERPGSYHDVRLGIEGGGELVIATTRPELLPACVAVVAHPDDERYRGLFGKRAVTPLFHAPVPILPAAHADPEKGTGIMVVCTFGDAMDVEFWRAQDLPLKQLLGQEGRLLPVVHGEPPFGSLDPARAREAYAELEGLTVARARRKTAELLAREGSALDGRGTALVGEPRPLTHPVKFYENGERPLELVTTRQWFIKLLEHREALLEQGRKIRWHPPHMRARYLNWVEGLNQDWCVSRQRYSGVPFPVWYPLGPDAEPDHDRPIFASADRLPIDPLVAVPPGFDPAQRDKPGGFSADRYVMDTWATSSLSPQIMSHWSIDPERHRRLFPMDVRPQAHEIIRTWAFYTIVKAWMHEREIPWRNVAISGWILDPDRKKMAKSKGNVVTAEPELDEYSADAVRYWSGRARLGVDTAVDRKVFQTGRRLCTKIFNASRFVLLQLDRVGADYTGVRVAEIREPLDLAYAQRLRTLVAQATERFEDLDCASALHAIEAGFWELCDDYLELVKVRSYADADSPARRSATATLELGLRTFLRLFAPVMPHVTEEVWSWRFAGAGRDRSIHTTAWPGAGELEGLAAPEHAAAFDCAVEVLRKIRATKTRAQRSLRWPVARLAVRGDASGRGALEPALRDVLEAGNVAAGACALEPLRNGPPVEGDRFDVDVVLADEGERT